MEEKFSVILLEEVREFLAGLNVKARTKILFNIRKAQIANDPKLFKKLTEEIWEFRTLYNGLQYRLFAFWDKSDKSQTLVISTHGMVKKTDKVPKQELEKADKIRTIYLKEKNT